MFKRFVNSFSKEICPFCFEEFSIHNSHFRCSSDFKICPPEVDKVFSDKWGDPKPMSKVIVPPSNGLNLKNRVTRQVTCPECSGKTRKRLCPNCHSQLPVNTGELNSFFIAMVGAKATGKSNYLAVLIEQLRKVIGPRVNILIQPANEATMNRYNDDFYYDVYVNQTALQSTDSGRSVNSKVRQPMVFTMTISRKDETGEMVPIKIVNLVFYDTAGEDLNSLSSMTVANKYLTCSKGFILLLDPLQFPTVREKLQRHYAGQKLNLPPIGSSAYDVLSRINLLFENETGSGIKMTKKIPVAVTFSKMDMLQPLLGPEFQINGSANHDHGYDLADFNAVNSEMRSLLKQWGANDVLQLVEQKYKKHGFFGVSALGYSPDDKNKIVKNIMPRRVEDPLFWLLHVNGLLPTSENSYNDDW